LSLGVPMLLAGDEMGRSQRGNNNAYSQDNEVSWIDWLNLRPEDEELRLFVAYLIRLRRSHRVFSRPRFFRGEVLSEAGVKDITWLTPAGKEAVAEDWRNPFARSLAYVLSGAAGVFFTPGGQRDIDESFLVMMNAYFEDLDFSFPLLAAVMSWEPLVDTAEPTGRVAANRLYEPGDTYRLRARSLALFINRAPRTEMTAVAVSAVDTMRGHPAISNPLPDPSPLYPLPDHPPPGPLLDPSQLVGDGRVGQASSEDDAPSP
jgi:isoamylase